MMPWGRCPCLGSVTGLAPPKPHGLKSMEKLAVQDKIGVQLSKEARPREQQMSTEIWSARPKNLDTICTKELVKIFEQISDVIRAMH